MAERDRVLDAFRNCITEPKCKDCPWTECNTLDNGDVEIPRDLALAVMRELVAQEPRVMTLEELEDWDGAVFFEAFETDMYYALIENIDLTAGMDGEYVLVNVVPGEHHRRIWGGEHYGEIWRCWTSRPIDAQREATAWEQ